MSNKHIPIRLGMPHQLTVQLVNAEITIGLAVWPTADLCFLQDTRCQSLLIYHGSQKLDSFYI